MNIAGFDACIGRGVAAIRAKEYQPFINYFVRSMRQQIYNLGTGATFPNISADALGSFRLSLPPLTEQKRIVAILDQALAAIATATAHAQKNLANARELFDSQLNAVFTQQRDGWVEKPLHEMTETDSPITYGVVKPGPPGDVLFVRGGDLAQGQIAVHELRTITKTVSNQYRRTLLHGGELLICLVGQPGATAVVPELLAGANIARQVGLIRLSNAYDAEFVSYFLRSPIGQSALGAYESGSVQQVINLRELKLVRVPAPPAKEQRALVAQLRHAESDAHRLEAIYQRKLVALAELKQSILHKAFAGELTARKASTPENTSSFLFPAMTEKQGSRLLYAGLLAVAYMRHKRRGQLSTLGDIKREKIVHLIEAHCDIDLGRSPIKMAAGPADLKRRNAVESYARDNGYFSVAPTPNGNYIEPGPRFEELISSVQSTLESRMTEIEAFIDRFVPMKTRRAEIIATAYSAWNNLLIDGFDPSDDEIIYESREKWHPDKIDITPDEFRVQLNWMRMENIRPRGTGAKVDMKAGVA